MYVDTLKVHKSYTGMERSLGLLEDKTHRISIISKMKVVMLLDLSIGRLYLPEATVKNVTATRFWISLISTCI
jgi:hypothetical protein